MPSADNDVVREQNGHPSNESSTSLLAQKLNDESTGDYVMGPASEHTASADDSPPYPLVAGRISCEERISRLEEQLARLIDNNGPGGGKAGSDSQHGLNGDEDPSGSLFLRRYNSHERSEFARIIFLIQSFPSLLSAWMRRRN